jgi:hypothetical protein
LLVNPELPTWRPRFQAICGLFLHFEAAEGANPNLSAFLALELSRIHSIETTDGHSPQFEHAKFTEKELRRPQGQRPLQSGNCTARWSQRNGYVCFGVSGVSSFVDVLNW